MPRTATLVVPAADRWSDDAGRAVVTAFVSSGQSPTEFSRQHGIDVQRLYRWRRRLGLEATVTQAPAFIEVTPRPDTPVEIVIAIGACTASTRVDRSARAGALRRGARVLSLPPSVRVFVATQAVDGRKGADSLMVIVRDVFRYDPLGGHLFVFFSKRCDRVRIVYWDRNGFAMWAKRLERGRFHPAFSADGVLRSTSIEAADLALIVEGIDLAGARRRPRWEPSRKSYGALNP